MAIGETSNCVLDSGSTTVGQSAVITVEGVIGRESTYRLDRELARAMHEETRSVTLDLSRLQLIDTAVIAWILRVIEALRATGTDLEVRYPSPMALQLFEICSLIEVVGIDFSLDPHTQLDPEDDFGRLT